LRWQKRPFHTLETGPAKRQRMSMSNHLDAVTTSPVPYWEESYPLPVNALAVPAVESTASMHGDLEDGTSYILDLPHTTSAYFTHSAPSLPISEDVVFERYLVDGTVNIAEASPSTHELPRTAMQRHACTSVPGHQPTIVNRTGASVRRPSTRLSQCVSPPSTCLVNAGNEIPTSSIPFSDAGQLENGADAVRPSDLGWHLNGDAQSPSASMHNAQNLLRDELPCNSVIIARSRPNIVATASEALATNPQLQQINRQYSGIG
jgi:hypothetical protein